MLSNNELNSYLLDIEDECKNKIEILIKQIAESKNVTEELKASNAFILPYKYNHKIFV